MMYREGSSPKCSERRKYFLLCMQAKLKQPNLREQFYEENKLKNQKFIKLNQNFWKLRDSPPKNWPIPTKN